MRIDEETAAKAERVFLDPDPVYGWDEIVTGDGAPFAAVGGNTFRGFHRVDQGRPGAKEVFVDYFVRNRASLLGDLRDVETGRDLHEVSDRVVAELVAELEGVVKASQLGSYNKVRKPVDLYVEHLVAMARELDGRSRERLVPLLFLPLDSQVFGSETCFRESELRQRGLTRSSTYSALTNKWAYSSLQAAVSEKAGRLTVQLGVPFHRIYFDLVWNGRWRRSGGNLFALNPT